MPAPKATASKPTHESKPKNRVPLPTPELLKRLFKTLVAQIDGGHHANAVRTCDKILRIAPTDPDALQTKLFLLLRTDQAAAALALIDSLTGEGQDALKYTFERAYALYCLQKMDDAHAALQQEEDARGTQHLEAQINYRGGTYQAAFDLYNELLDSAPTPEEHSDILVNIHAASAHLDFINTTFLHALDALSTTTQSQIESAPPPAAATSLPAAALAAPAPAPAQADAPKKKIRLPPGVVLGVTPLPDPERWLKKSERTNFGQRRRRGAGGGGGGGATQGSAADVHVPVVESGKSGGKGKGKKRK
ncbi:hypothetical protein C8J57DRAFT_1170651 [Mycena rebaudengoi]|nr:hypothetical protein C8J57DRAFT_1170651 [Mycena rebaudengoi]